MREIFITFLIIALMSLPAAVLLDAYSNEVYGEFTISQRHKS